MCLETDSVTVIKQCISTLTELHLPQKAVNHVSQTIIELTWCGQVVKTIWAGNQKVKLVTVICFKSGY